MLGPRILMPTGVLMPVESISILAFMGMVKELETPGMVRASFISMFSLSTVMPFRHWPRLQVDHGLEHLQRRRIGGRFGPSGLAEYLGHFRYLLQDLVLELKERGDLRDETRRGTVTGM